jgi:hypothetical protein
LNTPDPELVIFTDVPLGAITEVEPTLKVPVLAILEPCPVRLIVQGEFEVPAENVPVLVIGIFWVPKVMVEVESAVKVPALVILIPLLPELAVIVILCN